MNTDSTNLSNFVSLVLSRHANLRNPQTLLEQLLPSFHLGFLDFGKSLLLHSMSRQHFFLPANIHSLHLLREILQYV